MRQHRALRRRAMIGATLAATMCLAGANGLPAAGGAVPAGRFVASVYCDQANQNCSDTSSGKRYSPAPTGYDDQLGCTWYDDGYSSSLGVDKHFCIAAATAKSTLATFAGRWIGHTRQLTITPGGIAREHVDDGCCDPVIDLHLRLSHPRGTERRASVTARVSYVHVLDHTAFTHAFPAPKVGQVRVMRLRRGVITEPFIHTNYCDQSAGDKGTCGA